ncbi:MAG TPA: hypothetical protein VJB67_03460 [Patescibacteria group bacterium]|nr:hypothetical protein [Patescibacteria group bacterium]
MTKRQRKIRFTEFLVIGLAMGVVEDMIAILLATDTKLSWHVFLVAFSVALPFAFISEYVVDHPRFWEFLYGGDGK